MEEEHYERHLSGGRGGAEELKELARLVRELLGEVVLRQEVCRHKPGHTLPPHFPHHCAYCAAALQVPAQHHIKKNSNEK